MNNYEDISIIIADSSAQEILSSVQKIRHDVFINEQNVAPERDIDGLDEESHHALLICDGRDAGCARFRIVDNIMKIERLAVLKEFRNYGFSRLIMLKILGYGDREGVKVFKIHAQKDLKNYYMTFGFVPVGEVFMDAGMPHVEMELVG